MPAHARARGERTTEPTVSRPCPVCGRFDTIPLVTVKFALHDRHPLPSEMSMVECPGCDLVYDSARRPWAALDEYYASVADFGSARQISTGDDLEESGNVAQRAERIVRHLASSGGTILDVGCGGGATLRALRAAGFGNLLGLDPNEQALARLRADGIPCLRADVRSARERLGGARFDAIVLSHVLEHLPEFDDVVTLLGAALKPRGVVYAEVPDAARYPSRFGFPFHFLDKEHLQHFDLPQLALLLSRAGLFPVEWGRTPAGRANRSIFPAVWIAAKTGGRGPLPPADGGPIMRSYLGAQVQRLRVLDDQLEWLVSTSPATLVLWGFGAGMERLWAMSRAGRLPWAHVFDRDRRKHGWRVGACTIRAPGAVPGGGRTRVLFGSFEPDRGAVAEALGHLRDMDLVYFADPETGSELVTTRLEGEGWTEARPVPIIGKAPTSHRSEEGT